ncbi:MAG: molybdenum cofactor guanylyltransferase MobA [Pseudomonadota bacterium]
MTIAREDITGLVLAGGRGSRMGGADKGLQNHLGIPLALHALLRLAPQVGPTLVNANRNLAAYEAMGSPVWPDALPDYPGPLAGFLAGLERCETPYLVTVPCDTPDFPTDLVARLAQALARDESDIAIAATREPDGSTQVQPVFCLMRASLLESLVRATTAGERKIDRWAKQHRCSEVLFEESGAFFNANTLAELQSLQPRR